MTSHSEEYRQHQAESEDRTLEVVEMCWRRGETLKGRSGREYDQNIGYGVLKELIK